MFKSPMLSTPDIARMLIDGRWTTRDPLDKGQCVEIATRLLSETRRKPAGDELAWLRAQFVVSAFSMQATKELVSR